MRDIMDLILGDHNVQVFYIATVDNQSSNTYNSIGDPIGQTHWIQPITFVSGLGTMLTDNNGLHVHLIRTSFLWREYTRKGLGVKEIMTTRCGVRFR